MDDMNLGNFRLSGGDVYVNKDGRLYYIVGDTEENNDGNRALGEYDEQHVQ